ncbi:MAG: ABC transporter ATP-binding protein [bacterium]|nr:ABC transporter ATP-binding protein [bacterium]
MIQLRDLHKAYDATTAVDGVSLEIRAGETFGLLGPNGAGKTTTIHLMVGVLQPDRGSVLIDGVGDPAIASVRRNIGVAPQTLSIYDELTAEENLRFFGRLYSLSGSALAERIDWAMEFSGLTERRRDRSKTFSGGMQRRLNLACALIHDPPVILLDEPTVGVDPQSRNHIFESIESINMAALLSLQASSAFSSASV